MKKKYSVPEKLKKKSNFHFTSIPFINKSNEDSNTLKDLKLMLSGHIYEHEILKSLSSYFGELSKSQYEGFQKEDFNLKQFLEEKMLEIKEKIEKTQQASKATIQEIDDYKDQIVNYIDCHKESKGLEDKIFGLHNRLIEKEHQILHIERLITKLNKSKNKKRSGNSKSVSTNTRSEEFIEDFEQLHPNTLSKVYEASLKEERNNFAKYSRHINFLNREIENINIECKKIESGAYSSKDSTTDKTNKSDNLTDDGSKINVKEHKLKLEVQSREKEIEELNKQIEAMELSALLVDKEIAQANEELSQKFLNIIKKEKEINLSKKKFSQTERLSGFN